MTVAAGFYRFPLTLTLSLEERGQPLADFLKFARRGAEVHRGFTRKQGAFLPLPKGEGRGEGKGRPPIHNGYNLT
jgi:hypothetical protein